MQIISISETNLNEEHYDPERCHNGGGYYQPEIQIMFDDGSKLVICDTSCGEFGSRIHASYYISGEMKPVAECSFGSMLDHGQEYSSFSRALHSELLNLVYNATGYGLLTKERLIEEKELI